MLYILLRTKSEILYITNSIVIFVHIFLCTVEYYYSKKLIDCTKNTNHVHTVSFT